MKVMNVFFFTKNSIKKKNNVEQAELGHRNKKSMLNEWKWDIETRKQC